MSATGSPSSHHRGDLDIERNRASNFRHPPIDFTNQQIRLIQIVRSHDSSPIKCEFVRSTVDDQKLRYTSLSYTWGPAEKESDIVPILIDNQTLWIRQNLWSFLNRARCDPLQCADLFWIDSICIDQAGNGVDGLQEKGHQVNMMKKIYSNAHQVICWLGEPSSNSLAMLRDVESHLHGEASWNQRELALRGIYHIFNLDYWTRVWIVQEFVLAKSVLLKYGSFSFSWEYFDTYFRTNHGILHFPLPLRNPLQSLPKAFPILQCKFNGSQTYSSDVGHVLSSFKEQICSNPLDKIYGLLGLLDPGFVTPDYTKTPIQLYEEIIHYARRHNMLTEYEPDAFMWGPVPRCRAPKCSFPIMLGSILGLKRQDIGNVYTRLARDEGQSLTLIHPFSDLCDESVSPERFDLRKDF